MLIANTPNPPPRHTARAVAVAAAVACGALCVGCDPPAQQFSQHVDLLQPGERCFDATLCPNGGLEYYEIDPSRIDEFDRLVAQGSPLAPAFTPWKCECQEVPEVRVDSVVPDCPGAGLRLTVGTGATGATSPVVLGTACVPQPSVSVESIPPGETCALGGVRVLSSVGGATPVPYVTCFAARQLALRPIDPGTECAAGGVVVTSWIDLDADGAPSADESAVEEVLCNGASYLDELPFALGGRVFRRTFAESADIAASTERGPLGDADARALTADGLAVDAPIAVHFSDVVVMESPGRCELEVRVNGSACASGTLSSVVVTSSEPGAYREQVEIDGQCDPDGFADVPGQAPRVEVYGVSDVPCRVGDGDIASLQVQNFVESTNP